MEATLLDRQQKLLLKKFHTMCGKAGIGEENKRELVAAYGVASSRELSARELLDLCDRIDRMTRPDAAELDKWRKRLIAAIFGWRKACLTPAPSPKGEGRTAQQPIEQNEMNIVKAIACRAAQADRFNAIPLERLRSLYYAFGKKTKDLAFVDKLTSEELDYLTFVN